MSPRNFLFILEQNKAISVQEIKTIKLLNIFQ